MGVREKGGIVWPFNAKTQKQHCIAVYPLHKGDVEKINQTVANLLPVLPWIMVGLLALLCAIALFLIAHKFTDTWRLFYSKQKLINELLKSAGNVEKEEGDNNMEPKEKVLTIGEIDEQAAESE